MIGVSLRKFVWMYLYSLGSFPRVNTITFFFCDIGRYVSRIKSAIFSIILSKTSVIQKLISRRWFFLVYRRNILRNKIKAKEILIKITHIISVVSVILNRTQNVYSTGLPTKNCEEEN